MNLTSNKKVSPLFISVLALQFFTSYLIVGFEIIYRL